MKNISLIGLALVASLTAVTAADSDAKIIQGNWKPVAGELSGHAMAETVLQTISMKLEKGKYEVIADGRPDRGTYALDASTKPKGMTVTGTEGPNQGKTFPCIYELKADTLRICYDLSGAKRPTEFKSLPGTKLYLVTYARKKE
jgi:uncharacterized protein (TIGR03067 family)